MIDCDQSDRRPQELLHPEGDREFPGRQPRRLRDLLLGGRNSLVDLGQLGLKLVRALEAAGSVFLQAFEDDPAEVVGKVGIELFRILGLFDLVLDADGEGSVPFEGHAARGHLVEDDAQRIDVGPRVHVLALDLLRRHVFGRADHHARSRDPLSLERTGDPEIHDADRPLPVDHDVARLEVAVHDAGPMRLGQTLADLEGDVDRGPQPHLAAHADHVLEVFAMDIFHGDVMRPGETILRPASVLDNRPSVR